MPTRGYIKPAPLIWETNGLRQQVKAQRNSGLTGTSRYNNGDLVTLSSGNTTRLIEATPANIANVLVAGHDWDNPVTVGSLYNELIDPDEVWIATYQGSEADGANGLFEAADLALVQAFTSVELDYNATEDVMTVRAATTNPVVKLVGVYQGAVTTDPLNVLVMFKWLPTKLAGAV